MGNARGPTAEGPSLGAPEAGDGEPSATDTASRPPTDRRERILEALGDRWAREILLMLNDAPHSALEIQASNRIPQSTLYRRLHDLTEIGLVGIQRSSISADGKRVELYRSRLEELKVELRGGRLRIDVRFRDLAAERLKEMWGAVRSGAGRP